MITANILMYIIPLFMPTKNTYTCTIKYGLYMTSHSITHTLFSFNISWIFLAQSEYHKQINLEEKKIDGSWQTGHRLWGISQRNGQRKAGCYAEWAEIMGQDCKVENQSSGNKTVTRLSWCLDATVVGNQVRLTDLRIWGQFPHCNVGSALG